MYLPYRTRSYFCLELEIISKVISIFSLVFYSIGTCLFEAHYRKEDIFVILIGRPRIELVEPNRAAGRLAKLESGLKFSPKSGPDPDSEQN
jgi:hypothetical protein